jgi:Flp pilus assembly protein TadG
MMRIVRFPKTAGQAIVELALVLPMLCVVTFTCFQIAILFLAYLSVMNTTRDLSRWVAVHPNTTDSVAYAALRPRVPPNLNSDSLHLTFDIQPPCSVLSAQNTCAGRAPGTQMSFTTTYDATSLIFLPTTFGCCGFYGSLPTQLPTYRIYMNAEPPSS